MFRNKLLAVAALIAGLLLPAQAMAAYEAYTRADLNLRVGPGTTYGVIDVIPYGEPVIVLGCLEGYFWCDVEWYGLRGWVAAEYLVQPGTTVYLPHFAPRVGLPIIGFSFYTYHERHYRDRPWYKKRSGRWRGRDWDRDRRSRDRPRSERRRDRRDADRPRQGERIQRSGPTRQYQRERPRSEQRSEQRRERRLDVERSQERQRIQQLQERPRAEQRRDRPRAEQRRQRQEASEPRRGERTQRRGSSRGESRSRSRGDSDDELILERQQ
jgi:uncharacterized protein YraI